jgi:hypothetical protein
MKQADAVSSTPGHRFGGGRLRRTLNTAWQWLRRTVFRIKRKPDVYERKLRDVFWEGDRLLAIRMARVCVLFEDLRLEYLGSRTTSDLPLDALSKQYRKFYFLRL